MRSSTRAVALDRICLSSPLHFMFSSVTGMEAVVTTPSGGRMEVCPLFLPSCKHGGSAVWTTMVAWSGSGNSSLNWICLSTPAPFYI
jgi:hypothetical protein